MLKRIAIFVSITIVGLVGLFSSADARSYVSGYTRSNGTYVNSYYRSSPNAYKFDNYSYKSYQPVYNNSYYYPTRNYSASWYTPYR